MDEAIDAAIQKLAEQAKATQDSLKAQQFAQAAMNLAHAKANIAISRDSPKGQRPKGGGA